MNPSPLATPAKPIRRRRPIRFSSQIVVPMRPEHRDQIAELAEDGGRTLAAEARRALEAWIELVDGKRA